MLENARNVLTFHSPSNCSFSAINLVKVERNESPSSRSLVANLCEYILNNICTYVYKYLYPVDGIDCKSERLEVESRAIKNRLVLAPLGVYRAKTKKAVRTSGERRPLRKHRRKQKWYRSYNSLRSVPVIWCVSNANRIYRSLNTDRERSCPNRSTIAPAAPRLNVLCWRRIKARSKKRAKL